MRPALAASAGAVVAATLLAASPAQAAIPDSLRKACERRDAADGKKDNGFALPFFLCDDGVPPVGGTTVNQGGLNAVTVPQSYGGDGFTGLPPKAAPQPGTGADGNGEIALDVDVSWPDPERFPPPEGGYPLVAFMHGCCSGNRKSWEADSVDATGERWHYSNAWFASRGYAVLTYTARGFVDANGRGSTGQTQLDSRRYEINDYQHLAGQLADTTFEVGGRKVTVDPSRMVATGGSYGGGFSWLAFTDPTWRSPAGKDMRLVAAAPKYGWTDLAYALVPNGTHLRDRLPPTDPAEAGALLGYPKRSIVAALYASGKTGVPPPGAHTTFAPAIDDGFLCLQSPAPFTTNPQCSGLTQTLLPEFLNDRSAYYQNHFFERIKADRRARVPLFSAGTFTDQLFTNVEHRRMVTRLKSVVPDYPVQEFYGDYNHFVQNKPKEWGDVCGTAQEARVCRYGDYPGGDLDAQPEGLRRAGVTTRLTRFLDHYAKPQANPDEPKPTFDVSASLQICPANAGDDFPGDQPGERFTESSFDALAPERLRLEAAGEQATTNDAQPNGHSAAADPIANLAANGARCPVSSDPAGAGVAVYDFAPLAADAVMIGRPRLTVDHTGTGTDLVLTARLYEVLPNGTQVLVDRGMRALTGSDGPTTFDLHGNAWRFTKGNALRLEIAQDDDPFIKSSTLPSSLTISKVALELPVRSAGPDARVEAPLLASNVSRGPRFAFIATSRSGDLAGISRFEATTRDTRGGVARAAGPNAAGFVLFRGRPGRTYRHTARLFDRRGVPGQSAGAVTLVPLDDRRSRSVRYRGSWRRVSSRRAWRKRLSRSSRRGARLSFRFRGSRVFLVGRTGPRGGRALVKVGGRRRRVSFRSRRVRNRAVVFSARARGRRRLTLTVLRGRVELDALGALRR